MCESCSGDKAEAFCRQCTEFICAECVRLHQRLKVFSGHKTVSLNELKKGGAKDIVVPKAPLKMCEEHDEQMKIYCHDCSCLICRDCIIENHNGHKHEFVKKAAPKVSKELLEQLNPLKKVGVKLSHTMEHIKTIKDEVKVQVDTVSKKIKTSFNELRKILANREQELLKEATAKGEQKLDLLSNQEKKLSTSRAVVQSVIEYTKQCLEHVTNEDIMSMRADIQSQIKRELTQLESKDLYEPVEEADIALEVECAEDLKQICLTKAKLTQLVLEYSVTGEGIEGVDVNELAEFYVTAKVPGQKQSERIVNLECYLLQPIQQQIQQQIQGCYQQPPAPPILGTLQDYPGYHSYPLNPHAKVSRNQRDGNRPYRSNPRARVSRNQRDGNQSYRDNPRAQVTWNRRYGNQLYRDDPRAHDQVLTPGQRDGWRQPIDYEEHYEEDYEEHGAKCKVDLIKNYEYRIQYTPTVCGQHQIILTSCGQEISESPFHVYVS